MQDTLISQNIIITEPCMNLRALGRNALAGKWKMAIVAVILYMLCTSLPFTLLNSIFGQPLGSFFSNNGDTYGMSVYTYANFYNSLPKISFFGMIYYLLVQGPMLMGLYMFFLAIFRKHDTSVADIFLGFEFFFKAIGLWLMIWVRIFLWSLLFIVPGIIATYRYSQAFFILADDSSKPINQCIYESKLMMKGNKMKYFVLSLSFIGWILLSVIPLSMINNIGLAVSTNVVVLDIFLFIGNLCTAPVYTYIYSTSAGFYEILAGHLIKETEPVTVTSQETESLSYKPDTENIDEKDEPIDKQNEPVTGENDKKTEDNDNDMFK